MSKDRIPSREALDSYITEGNKRTHPPIFQDNFLDQVQYPEFSYSSNPTISYRTCCSENYFIEAVHAARMIYIPGYTGMEASLLAESFQWFLNNRLSFNSGIERDHSSLPPEVLINERAFTFCQSIAPSDNYKASQIVGYPSGTTDFVTDIHRSTLSWFELNFRTHPLEGKPFNSDIQSTTRNLYMMTSFYNSGGEEFRPEAVDFISSYIAMRYIVVDLQKRAKQPISWSPKLLNGKV